MKQHRAYTNEDYVKVHNLAYKYKEGDKDAGEELLDCFSIFLNRYVSLLHYGSFDLKHTSIRNFLRLFVQNQIKRAAISSYKHNNGAGECAAQEVAEMVKSYFSSSSKEDLMQEVSSIFLVMASKYKDTKPSFQNHVDKNFHFYAFRSLEKLTRDPLARGSLERAERSVSVNTPDNTIKVNVLEQIEDEQFTKDLLDVELSIQAEQTLIDSKLSVITNLDCTKDKVISVYDDAFLDANWVNGVTCSEVFGALTPFERRVLVMWYIDNKTDTEIANEFGLCRGTINNKKSKAKEKLLKEIKRLNLYVK